MSKIIISLLFILLLLPACESIGLTKTPKITARPGTAAHMELTKPSITKWAYEVRTSSRTFLTPKLAKDGDKYTLYGCYVYNGNGWDWRSETFVIDTKTWPVLEIKKAPELEIR